MQTDETLKIMHEGILYASVSVHRNSLEMVDSKLFEHIRRGTTHSSITAF